MYCNIASVYLMYLPENVWITCNDKILVACSSAMVYVKNAQSKIINYWISKIFSLSK